MNHQEPPKSSQALEIAALADHLDVSLEKPLGRQAWLARNRDGALVVIKSGPGTSAQLIDILGKFKTLFPPFRYPQKISAQPDFYLMYDFIPGVPFSEAEYESEAALTTVFDLSGRITALFRSLRLAPMFQGWQNHGAAPHEPQGAAARQLAALKSGLECQIDGLALRRGEASQSYAWAQEMVPYCSKKWPESDASFTPPWSALHQRVETVTSIHLAASGSNLAHTSFTPEHLLLTPGDRWGVVGWQIAARPYNYMRYCYLAWCLVHTGQGEIAQRYRHFLRMLPAVDVSAAHLLTFALCLIAAWVEADPAITRRTEKLQAILSFINEALVVTEVTPT